MTFNSNIELKLAWKIPVINCTNLIQCQSLHKGVFHDIHKIKQFVAAIKTQNDNIVIKNVL